MRIKKIELVGFKSFKDRTVIQFDAGITGIVGPNGCGKSNIVDALVWVMGEMSAKDLRGSTMTDVIFAGAEGYSPMGMCEVSLVLENDGGPFPAKYLKHTEIMVTRRLHRSGEGEYFINKEPARLRDVQEIFMDTGAGSKGFSIIQQGMIGKIITSKPEDRRMLIEEAAGITKFKARKKESVRKLQATDQNLVRLQDIIGELKRQIDSLQRQAQRAERYRTIKNQMEEIDLWLSSRQYADLKTVADEAERTFNEAQGAEAEGESQLAGLQTLVEELKLQLLEKEKTVETKQIELASKQAQAQKRELEIQELKFEIEQARRNEQMTGTILQEQEARRELLERDHQKLNSEVEELETESQELETLFKEKNARYEDEQSRITEVDDELTTRRREMFGIGQTESSIDARLQSLNQQILDIQEREEQGQQLSQELREKKLSFEERKLKISEDLEQEQGKQQNLGEEVTSLDGRKKSLEFSQREKKDECDEFKDQLNKVTSRLYGLENLHSNLEGFEEGVKQVILWQKTRKRSPSASMSLGDGGQESSEDSTSAGQTIFQPVSEVVEVPSEYEIAMEAALGSRLQMLLSSSESTALEAVDYLKESKVGRSSFMGASLEGTDLGLSSYLDQESRLNESKGEALSSQEGVKGLLRNVVTAGQGYEKVVAFLLRDVVVVDSIRTALRLRSTYPGWVFVTLDGDTLSPEGVITGGSAENAEAGVLKRRREIKELSQKKDEWAGKLSLAQEVLKKVEAELADVLVTYEATKKKSTEQEIRVAELKKDFERSEHELANAEYAVEKQEREIQKIRDQIQTQQSKQEELNQVLLETREKKANLDITIEELNNELAEARQGFDDLQEEVTDLQVRSASKSQEYQGLQRQLEMVTKSLGDLESQVSKMSEESQHYSVVMSENQLSLEEKKIEFERWARDVEELRLTLAHQKDEYERLHSELREKEDSSSQSQRARNDRQMRMNEAQLRLEQARLKEQYLVDQVRERYMLLLSEIYEKHLDREGELSEGEVQLKELREKLARIGEVNLSAIDEYNETSKRYEFLTKQHNDLIEAKENLRKVIDRINRICSKRFKETFDLVNDRFTRVFPVLFGGGEAKLELHEDPEKHEMGVEIIARPPGKKMQNVSLMSGGEKALTAVALVFSIFLVKPSPYCLLDEVDAPLDDANVFRFNDLVREMAKRSQIIVVTHNKHTMEVAKKLYGVTMQERGVSTMVSVSLSDIK